VRLPTRVLAVLLAAAGLLLATSGCGYGRIYTRIVLPLDTDFSETPVMARRGSDDVKGFQYYGRLDWGTGGIGEIARRHGFTKVHYADVERLELLGIFSRTWVHVYGEREPEGARATSAPEAP
jgi:hypothetical protein